MKNRVLHLINEFPRDNETVCGINLHYYRLIVYTKDLKVYKKSLLKCNNCERHLKKNKNEKTK